MRDEELLGIDRKKLERNPKVVQDSKDDRE